MRATLRSPKNLALVAGAIVLAWLASSALAEWMLIRRARAPFPEPVPEWGTTRIESVRIETRDGESLGAWFVRATDASVAVLVMHGNGSSRSSESELVRWLSDEGTTVLAPSLRAHGDSSGSSNDFGWSAREDVVACVAFLEQRAPGSRVVVIGQSAGAAAAIYAAGTLGHRVSAYVLEAPYRDVRSATKHRLAMYLPPVLDRVAYSGLRLWAGIMLAPSLDQLSPLDHVAEIPSDTPVVFLSGTEDQHAPIAEVEEIRARCGSAARMVAFERASHRPLFARDPSRYAGAVRAVLDAAARH